MGLLPCSVRRIRQLRDHRDVDPRTHQLPASTRIHGRHPGRGVPVRAGWFLRRPGGPRLGEPLRGYRSQPDDDGDGPGGADTHLRVLQRGAHQQDGPTLRYGRDPQRLVGHGLLRKPRYGDGRLLPGAPGRYGAYPHREFLVHSRVRHDRRGTHLRACRTRDGASEMGLRHEAVPPLHGLCERSSVPVGARRGRTSLQRTPRPCVAPGENGGGRRRGGRDRVILRQAQALQDTGVHGGRVYPLGAGDSHVLPGR